MELEALDHVAVIVRDLPSATGFYEQVLGLRRVHEQAWGEYPVALVAGSSGAGVALFPAGDDGELPDETDENVHFAFRTSQAGYEGAKAELTARGIPFDEWDHDVAWLSTSTTPIDSLKHRTLPSARGEPTPIQI